MLSMVILQIDISYIIYFAIELFFFSMCNFFVTVSFAWNEVMVSIISVLVM